MESPKVKQVVSVMGVLCASMFSMTAKADPPPTVSFFGASDNRGITNDWDPNYWKATCDFNEAITGISRSPALSAGHAALCTPASTTVTELVPFISSGGSDNRGYVRIEEWASGFVKLECAMDQYIVGVSQSTDTATKPFSTHGILCGQGAAGRDNATVTYTIRIVDQRNSMASQEYGDWDANHLKGQCFANEHIVGISFSPTTGGLHSLLCSAGPN